MEKKWVLIPDEIENPYQISLAGLKQEGITYFAHGIKIAGVRSCYFSDQKWGQSYIEKKFYEVDPYTLNAENTNSAYILWDSISMDKGGQEICQIRNEMCGLVKGVTFSIHQQDFHEIIALGTPYGLFNTEEFCKNNQVRQILSSILEPARLAHFKYRYGATEK